MADKCLLNESTFSYKNVREGATAWSFPLVSDFEQLKHLSADVKWEYNKGRSRISMDWVPPLGSDPYCEGKWQTLHDEFTPSINSKNNFLQKL